MFHSADFRIIPQNVAPGNPRPELELKRYLITYATDDAARYRYVALDENSRLTLVTDEKLALRFNSIELAQQRLDEAIQSGELQNLETPPSGS